MLTGRYLVIATGAKPVDLNIPGVDYITTSDQFLELDNLPNQIVFIGGGTFHLNLHILQHALVLKK